MTALLGIRRLVLLAAALSVVVLLLPASRPAGAGLLGTAADTLLGDSEADFSLGGQPCELIEVPTAAPLGSGPCPGVRPGALVETDIGMCTLNYLFAGGADRFIGTAGHCIIAGGEQSWSPGQGPEARDSLGNRIGEFAYAVLQDEKDFSLIRLDHGVQADPQMCHFGGPTGINDDRPGLLEPVILQHYGNGVPVGDILPARTAVATGMPDPDHLFADGVVVPGDSGSAINSADGRAVGVVVTLGVHLAGLGTGGLDAGVIGVTRLTPQVERAEDVLGVELALQTAPTL